MNVDYLIQLLGNRINALNASKEQAFSVGDLNQINALDMEINEVLNTLNKLRLLQGISQTAAITPYTEAEIVQTGIEASLGTTADAVATATSSVSKITVTDGSIDCLEEYDISSYATDPLHEEKIKAILAEMGKMKKAEEIDAYIQSANPGSPVTGLMVADAAFEYEIDTRLMMAIMELDSGFGTLGVGARTFNPGNVGNTGEKEKTYSSWKDGVLAVAEWLYNHKIAEEEEEVDEEEEESDSEEETTTETSE